MRRMPATAIPMAGDTEVIMVIPIIGSSVVPQAYVREFRGSERHYAY